MIADFVDSFSHSFSKHYLKQVIYPFEWIYLYRHQKNLFKVVYIQMFMIQTACQIQVEENRIDISSLKIKLWCGEN